MRIIEIRNLKDTEIFKTDVRQVFDFIRYAENKEKLAELVENDTYYQHMDEEAFDVVNQYVKPAELVQVEGYRRKDGMVNMCKAIR